METDALLFMRKELRKAKDDPGKLRMIAKIAKVRESTLTRILDGTTKEPKEHTTRRIINALFEVYPELRAEYFLTNILPLGYEKAGNARSAGSSMEDVEAFLKMLDILRNRFQLDPADVEAFFAVLNSVHNRLAKLSDNMAKLSKLPDILDRVKESIEPKKN